MSPPTLAGPQGRDADTLNESGISGREIQPLLQAAREGDRQSIGELLDHYRSYLTLLGSLHFQRRLQARVGPSDIVQEALLRAHRHFGQFRGQTEPELMAWLREILVNSLARYVELHVRAAKRDVRRDMPLDGIAGGVSSAQPGRGGEERAPSADLLASEGAGRLAELLAQLPEHYRQVLVLRNIQGLSFEEVAARLERSPGATRMLWLRAIEKLRAVYRKVEHDDS
jgi:RNA polymerase sigma-70 factor (ECF subfamily)